MTDPTTRANDILLGLLKIVQGIDAFSDETHLLARVHTAGEDGQGELRLDVVEPHGDGTRDVRHFRITVEEVE